MIEIKKGTELKGLKKLREKARNKGLSPEKSFKLLKKPLKPKVVDMLKREQGHLCVYCMSRIPREDVEPEIPGISIEHFVPLKPVDGRDIGQGLDYQNLFAVCHGNTRKHIKGIRRSSTIEDLTCDKHRGNTEFRRINPICGETLKSIYYTLDGKIDADDPDVKYDLVNILNLNCESSPLISERKAVLDELIVNLDNIEENDLHNYCTGILNSFINEKDPKTPYVGVLIWYLKTLLEAL